MDVNVMGHAVVFLRPLHPVTGITNKPAWLDQTAVGNAP
jgi:hypothetical protein